MVPKEKIRRKENTESTENNSILIQLLWPFLAILFRKYARMHLFLH